MTPPFSSLRHRFFLALGGVLCFALLALILVARYQIMPILLEDEEQYASGELDRVERTLGSELNHMRRLVEDWAWWDDTYDFVQGQRPEYTDSNIYESTLETLDLKMMIFLDVRNQPSWVAGYDEDGEFTSCPDTAPPCDWATTYIDYLQARLDSEDEASQTWLLAQPGLAMAAMSGIYQSRETSPSAGWLMMVRPLSAPWLEQLRDTTGIDLHLTSIAAENEAVHESLERVSATHMAASRAVDAMPDDRLVRIDATLPRQRYQASLETFRFALYWTSGVLVLTLLVVLWLLESIVLAPLRQFSSYTQRLHLDTTPSPMPASLLKRHDEIGTLAQEFRHLLDHQYQQSTLLLELSQHDSLTGLANRRLFDEQLKQTMHQAQTHGTQVATLMIDIDHFKLYNDHYGHLAGDDCLSTLAEFMQGHLASHRFLAARTGGEEFSILMPGTSLNEALDHANELLKAINSLGLPHEYSPTSPYVTVSIGVAARQDNLSTPSDIMRAADQAMYQAKAGGRNRVAAYQAQDQTSSIER
ncbi:diguanylate cyclase [Halomonas sp. ANAO-440]|uniref:diguanylate cyclase n=1 Tax=Halomonas sp. ANAO-440 TaxID=2861360 RepID=UPI001CAA50BF|nr:diguanylate cyclase [Halomonas sp. ANAO-440]MBZ0331790.1 diguanylate cyclase [Halomonas sp. ANAO-440]